MTLAGGIASANSQETLKPTEQLQAIDSLALPRPNYLGQMAQPTHRWYGMSPVYGGIGWDNWELHKGLNMNLGASVFAQFGKHARHGAGFSQNIAAMYAMPLSKNLSFAAGGYLNNTYWGHDTYRDAGLSAVLGYRFNDHWEAPLRAEVAREQQLYSLLSLRHERAGRPDRRSSEIQCEQELQHHAIRRQGMGTKQQMENEE